MCSEMLTTSDRYCQKLTLVPYEPMVAENAPEAKVRLAMAIPSSSYNARPIAVSSKAYRKRNLLSAYSSPPYRKIIPILK